MSDVFISYARSTERAAELIETTLTGLGYTVWRDSSLPIHRPYPQVIEERLTAAKAVVVLWSKDAAGSDWVRAEADVARASKKLVQVSVDNTAPPLPFNQIQCGDLAGWTGDVAAPAWGKLMTSLSALVGTRAAFPSPQGNESFVPLRAVDAVLRPTKPSIAVLPFANLSRNPDQAYFAEGMVVEIVTALSRFAALLVIASSSSLTYRDATLSRSQIARELGVRYLLEGSVRQSSERVRISVELSDAPEGRQVWNERFDGTLEDVFALQDMVANAVAAQISPAIDAAEVRRASMRPTADLGAYDLYLRAIQAVQLWTKSGLLQAIALLDKAIARAPDYALALAFAARCHASASNGWSDDPKKSRETALELGRRALLLAPDDPEVLSDVAMSVSWAGDLNAADAMIERSLALNPGSATAWRQSGWIKIFGGRAELGVAHLQTALRLDPRSSNRPRLLTGLGTGLLFLGRYEEAVARLYEAAELFPAYDGSKVPLAAALAHANRLVLPHSPAQRTITFVIECHIRTRCWTRSSPRRNCRRMRSCSTWPAVRGACRCRSQAASPRCGRLIGSPR